MEPRALSDRRSGAERRSKRSDAPESVDENNRVLRTGNLMQDYAPVLAVLSRVVAPQGFHAEELREAGQITLV